MSQTGTGGPQGPKAGGGAKPIAAADQKPQPLTIFVGRASDSLDGIVGRIIEAFKNERKDHRVEFCKHDQSGEIRAVIDAAPAGTRIALVGHSWGGHTVAKIAESMGIMGRKLDVLVTIDPLSLFVERTTHSEPEWPSQRNRRGISENSTYVWLADVKRGAKEWVNVDATGGSLFDKDNFTAFGGGKIQ